MFSLLLVDTRDDKGLWTELSEPAFPIVIQYSQNYGHREVVLRKCYFLFLLKLQLYSCSVFYVTLWIMLQFRFQLETDLEISV
jgi:hypothetical protein